MAGESSKRFRMVQDGWFFGDTKVLRGDTAVAHFSFGSWKTQGTIEFDDVTYEVIRPKGLGPLLRMERDGTAVCETRISGMWNRRAELVVDGVRYVVTWPAFEAKTILRRGEVEVGRVSKWRAWARDGEAVFLPSVPPIVCVFVMWLATYTRIGKHG
jgi:hypothetical protein